MPEIITDIEEVRFTASDIEKVITDWYRRNHLPAGDTSDIEVVGIMNRVYISVEHKEVLTDHGRNQRGGDQTPPNTDKKSGRAR